MLLLSVDYFYSVMLRRRGGGSAELNITMTLNVPKSVWICSLNILNLFYYPIYPDEGVAPIRYNAQWQI